METSTSTSKKLYFFLNLSLLLLSYIPSSISMDFPSCDPHDQAVLLKIQDHFGGPKARLFWDNTSNCCSDWDGVGCVMSGSSNGRVNTVGFSGAWGLKGTIPSDFGDLPYLEYFMLTGEKDVTGPIPKAFGKLKKLYHFEVQWNSLTGPIPKELLMLKSLKEVNLSNNKLSGPIPAVVSSLTKLTQFDVSSNQLCGPIPSGLAKFGNASFDHNKCLCGPPLATPCKK